MSEWETVRLRRALAAKAWSLKAEAEAITQGEQAQRALARARKMEA